MVRRSVNIRLSCSCFRIWKYRCVRSAVHLLFECKKCNLRGPNFQNLQGGTLFLIPPPQHYFCGSNCTLTAHSWSFAAYSNFYWKPWTSYRKIISSKIPGKIWSLTGLTYEILIRIEFKSEKIGITWNFNCSVDQSFLKLTCRLCLISFWKIHGLH